MRSRALLWQLVGIAVAGIIASQSLTIERAQAQNLCREACVKWCELNRPTAACRADCESRVSCAKAGILCREKCNNWCNANKPGNAVCLADCAARRRC